MIPAVDRFDGLAEAYDVYRPRYPQAVFDDLAAQLPDTPRVAVDVGAGTGISTEQLVVALGSDHMVLALEPGADMRRVLLRRCRAHGRVQVFDASAEDMPLPDGSAALVTACTSYHWFCPGAFMAEAIRVLAPDGVLAILRNRRAASPLLRRFDAFIAAETCDDLRRLDAQREPSVRQLAAAEGLKAAKSLTLNWSRAMDRHALVAMYLTRAVVVPVVHRLGLGAVQDTLHGIYADEIGDGPVTLTYETSVKYARRR